MMTGARVSRERIGGPARGDRTRRIVEVAQQIGASTGRWVVRPNRGTRVRNPTVRNDRWVGIPDWVAR